MVKKRLMYVLLIIFLIFSTINIVKGQGPLTVIEPIATGEEDFDGEPIYESMPVTKSPSEIINADQLNPEAFATGTAEDWAEIVENGVVDINDPRLNARRGEILPELSLEKQTEFYSNPNTNLDEYSEQFSGYVKTKYKTPVEVAPGTSYKDGILTSPDGSTIDLNSFGEDTAEHSVKTEADKTQVDDNALTDAQNVRLEEGNVKIDTANQVTTTTNGEETTATGVEDATISENGYEYGSVTQLKQGVTLITNGENVINTPTSFKIGYADDMMYDGKLLANKIYNFEADKLRKVYVEKADNVNFVLSRFFNVTNSTFVYNASMNYHSAEDNLIYADATFQDGNIGHKFNFNSLTADGHSSVEYSKDNITKVNLTESEFNFTDTDNDGLSEEIIVFPENDVREI